MPVFFFISLLVEFLKSLLNDHILFKASLDESLRSRIDLPTPTVSSGLF